MNQAVINEKRVLPLKPTGGMAEVDWLRNPHILRGGCWTITLVAGFLQTWAARFSMTPDGTCYLDIASAYLRGDWHNALNSYWSPLFSWLLAMALGGFHPTPYWESTLLHLVNFAGLVTALACFEFFFRSFVRHCEECRSSEDPKPALPEFAWWALGYGLFLSTTLFLLPATDTSPDIWVSAFTYIIGGLILRIRIAGGGWGLFVLLGFTLAFAYFAKTFYFPLSFVFLLAAWMAAGNLRRTVRQAAIALLVFLFVAGPWIFLLSSTRHRFTFGDAGKVNAAIFVDQIPQYLFWQGENGSGVPSHPVRQLLAHPRVFEFASPIAGTYPPAFDLSYWMDGVRLRPNVHGPLGLLRQSFGTFFKIFQFQLEYAVLLLALVFSAGLGGPWGALRRQAYLWLPPLVACSAYAIVLVEFRYVAPFVLLLWLSAVSSFLPTSWEISPRLVLALVLAVFCATGLKATKFAVSDTLAIRSGQQNVDWEVAQGLRRLGLQPGDKVSAMAVSGEAHWARLARLKIVAEIPLGDESIFWSSSLESKQNVFRLLASTGAKLLVVRAAPSSALHDGWLPIGNTSFYGYPLEASRP